MHGVNRLNPALPGKECIKSPPERRLVPLGRGAETHSLPDSVNAGVGAPGRMGYGSSPKKALQHTLEFGLYRATCRLALPPDKAGAVVVKRGEEGPAHGPESSLGAGPEQATQLLVTIDKTQRSRIQFRTSAIP